MHRSFIARLATVFTLAGLAACDTPTSTSVEPATPAERPGLYLEVANVNVTSSGGTPLVSWNAVSGATGYTVRLIHFETINGQYAGHWYESLQTTTGTSYLATEHAYTGIYQCSDVEPDRDGDLRGAWYEYEVVTQFPTGTSSARHFAPITNAYC